MQGKGGWISPWNSLQQKRAWECADKQCNRFRDMQSCVRVRCLLISNEWRRNKLCQTGMETTELPSRLSNSHRNTYLYVFLEPQTFVSETGVTKLMILRIVKLRWLCCILGKFLGIRLLTRSLIKLDQQQAARRMRLETLVREGSRILGVRCFHGTFDPSITRPDMQDGERCAVPSFLRHNEELQRNWSVETPPPKSMKEYMPGRIAELRLLH